MSVEKAKEILRKEIEYLAKNVVGRIIPISDAIAELEAESKPEPCIGSDRLRKIAEETWSESCGPKRHLLTMADEFDDMAAQAHKDTLPALCPNGGNHHWRCECKKCGMRLFINMDLEEVKQ